MNPDVPDETIIRHQAIEIGKLHSELMEKDAKIASLKAQIENRDKAIQAFKEWQKKVAEYSWKYWLNEGLKMCRPENLPDTRVLNMARLVLGNKNAIQKSIDKIEKQCDGIRNAASTIYRLRQDLFHEGESDV